jgi:hypothetical protein
MGLNGRYRDEVDFAEGAFGDPADAGLTEDVAVLTGEDVVSRWLKKKCQCSSLYNERLVDTMRSGL